MTDGPHFLGIGLQKCGSTYLYRALDQHPHIAFPATAARLNPPAPRQVDGVAVTTLPKEVHFLKGHNENLSWPTYLSLFAGLQAQMRSGEITPLYAAAAPDRIAALRSHRPALRIFAMLRHPVERDWSAIRMIAARQGVLDDDAALIKLANLPQVLTMGDYRPQLQNWLQAFPRDQVHFAGYTDLTRDARTVVDAILRHIGVEPARPADPLPDPVLVGPKRPCPAALQDILQARHGARLADITALTGIGFSDPRI